MATIVPGNRTWKFYRERENDNTNHSTRIEAKDDFERENAKWFVYHARKHMPTKGIAYVKHMSITYTDISDK